MVILDSVSRCSLTRVLLSQAFRSAGKKNPLKVFYFNSVIDENDGWMRFLRRIWKFEIQKLGYTLVEVLEEDGGGVLMRTYSRDCREVSYEILKNELQDHPLVEFTGRRFNRKRLLVYLRKCISEELFPTLLQIKIVAWHQRGMKKDKAVVFYASRSPWSVHLRNFANRRGVDIRWYQQVNMGSPEILRRGLGKVVTVLRKMLPKVSARMVQRAKGGMQQEAGDKERTGAVKQRPVVAVGYTGTGLTLDLSKNSDLFWVPFTGSELQHFLVYFPRTDDPLDDEKWSFLEKNGMKGVALTHSAARCKNAKVWDSKVSSGFQSKLLLWISKGCFLTLNRKLVIQGWIFRSMMKFVVQYANGYCFFRAFGVKVHVNFADWTTERIVWDQALEDLGGISVSYQRSEEAFSGPVWASSVHVHFGFSKDRLEGEIQSGSYLRQWVASGYIRDCAFDRVKTRSDRLRSQLSERGVEFVVCYFDENSYADPRQGGTHEHSAQNYRFLFERLLEDERLGLILKPKKPSTLRSRICPYMDDLMDKALGSGRCVLFEEGIVASATLPCEASLAADVTIGLLLGSTAALESRLAGSPTVLLDREHLTYHPLQVLGKDRVVFDNWQTLWKALSGYREDPGALPGFGDWMPYLENLDSFQDRRAAERIGSYVGWLVEGLSRGMTIENCLEYAKRQYTTLWGMDKVCDIGQDSEEGLSIPDATGMVNCKEPAHFEYGRSVERADAHVDIEE